MIMLFSAIPLQKAETTTESKTILTLASCLLGALLNQSNVIFGMNISLADFVVVMLIGLLINYKLLQLSTNHVLTFIIFSAFLFVNAVFIIPNLYDISISAGMVITDYIKVVVSFLYFIIGYLIAKNGFSKPLLKWFAIAAVIIGFLGIVFTIVPIPGMVNLLFYETVRLKGLMNDPNYFSVIQCAAIAILLRYQPINGLVKLSSITILILSIFSSGSKTGFLTLGCLLVFWLMNVFLEGNMEVKRLIRFLFILFVFFLFLPNLPSMLNTVLETVSEKFPIFSRVELLLTDFNEAMTANGSGREEQWDIAINVIQQFPLFGVGNTGNYLTVVQGMSDMGNLAHNTYLQMAGEWGIPVTLFMIFYIVRIFFTPISKGVDKTLHLTTKEMLFAFLVSSMSLSFNNSRIFWLLLGMAVWYTIQANEQRNVPIQAATGQHRLEEPQ